MDAHQNAERERKILEARQRARMARRNEHRDTVRQVGCPWCLVDPGHPCRSDEGFLRVHNHQERIHAASTQGLVRPRVLKPRKRA